MTWRAVLIGLLLGLPLAAFGWSNDWVLGQAYVAGDMVPTSVYGLLVVGLLVANPLLRLLGKCHLRGSEWSVVVAMMLVATVIPGPGLMWNFNNTLVMPLHFNHNNPAWREHNLMSYVPPQMLVDPGDQYDKVVKGFATGMRQGTKLVNWTDVPWGAWVRPLSFWLPVLALSFIGGICLVLLVHRQWSQRERLQYPIAEFAGELLGGAGEGFWSRIFHNRRFWIGFGIAFGILMINGLFTWGQRFRWGGHLIQIPLDVNMEYILSTKWPFLRQFPVSQAITHPQFYFVVIGIAYFVSSEVSFSLGISEFAYLLFYWIVFQTGLKPGGDFFAGGFFSFQYFGAYLGMGVIVLYIGRRFYWSVLLNAFAIPTADRATRTEIWACRLALLVAAGLVGILMSIGLNWLVAILFVFLTGLLFLIVTRINVETGAFSIQPIWQPVGIVMGMFGVAAMGPNTLIILTLLGAVLTVDTKVCLMPMVANCLKFSERQGIQPARLSPFLGLSVLAALVAGVTVTLFFQYNYGAGGALNQAWCSEPGRIAFELLSQNMPTFEAQGPASTAFSLSRAATNSMFLGPVGLGLGLVLLCSMLRLRYQWWPIHPVLFLVWGSYAMAGFAWSFFFGWLIKAAITRFGGGESYRRNKPLFVGLVAGEFAASIIWVVIGLIYYFNNNYVAGATIRFHQ